MSITAFYQQPKCFILKRKQYFKPSGSKLVEKLFQTTWFQDVPMTKAKDGLANASVYANAICK